LKFSLQCDNREWSNFLKESVQPLPNDTADHDEEDDPDYKAEEEEIDSEELRMDKAVKVTTQELRTLFMEFLGGPDELDPSSEDEMPAVKTVKSGTTTTTKPTPKKVSNGLKLAYLTILLPSYLMDCIFGGTYVHIGTNSTRKM